MLTLSPSGATASTASPADSPARSSRQPSTQAAGATPRNPAPAQPHSRDQVRHLLFGTVANVQTTIRQLHKHGYADPNDWSRPISTGRADEVMAILTKRVVAE